MITFLICLALLIVAYFTYGKLMEKAIGIDPSAPVPSKTLADGLDYVPMPIWKTFLIQFLNIAGLGPIFGAILGAAYGPVAFIWITVGGIFLGAVQDFAAGVISLRNDGINFPDVVGKYLGISVKHTMRIFTLILMILVGTVFMSGPADVLSGYTGLDKTVWLIIIFAYYMLATLLPIDKIIGKIYPIFGIVLFLMAILMLYVIFSHGHYANIPELSFENYRPDKESFPIIPTLLITIACGAISGFHTTQSPLMARCMNSEKECKPVFYGAMISESIVALIWAAIAMSFFGGVDGLNEVIVETKGSAAAIIDKITSTSLGTFGIMLVILGVVFAPISTGDTALRMARLIGADYIKTDQKKVMNRVILSIPIFIVAFALTQINFDIIWRYFAWFNQVLAAFALWAICTYMRQSKYLMLFLIPAVIMTFVVTLFILISNQGFELNYNISLAIALAVDITITALFFKKA
ncbi:MAG: carbon starvation CstA family protein [Rikenellaceae bacterium]